MQLPTLFGVVAAAVAAVAHTAAAPPAAAPPVKTLATESRPIAAFALDGGRAAWYVAGVGRACNRVRVLRLADATFSDLPSPATKNVTCRWGSGPVQLALAADRVLWTLHDQGASQYEYLLTASASDPDERRLTEVAHAQAGPGIWLAGLAGDGPTLVYGMTSVAYVDQVECLSGGSCRMRVAGGGVFLVDDRGAPQQLASAPPAAALAANGTRVAVVPTESVSRTGKPLAGPDLAVEVRDATTGRLIAQAVPQGAPQAVALSATLLATLERTPAGPRLAWYQPATGEPIASVPVSTGATDLAAGTRSLVFRVGRTIRVVDTAAKHPRVRLLASVSGDPAGLAVDGNRVAWAENRAGRGRIRTIVAP